MKSAAADETGGQRTKYTFASRSDAANPSLPARQGSPNCPASIEVRSAHGAGSIARRNDPRILYHQNHRPLRRARAVHSSPGHNETLPRSKLDHPVLQIDEQLALDHIKELVVLIVLVPVVFAFDNGD